MSTPNADRAEAVADDVQHTIRDGTGLDETLTTMLHSLAAAVVMLAVEIRATERAFNDRTAHLA